MTKKDLIEWLDEFTDDAKIQIWQHTSEGDKFFRVELCCNFERQKEKNVVMLRPGFEESCLDKMEKEKALSS